MNLAVDKWIPCVYEDGRSGMASLKECFSDPRIVALAVRPHERVALMRLLLCVSYASVGIPKNYDAWVGCPEKLPEAAVAYLEKWKESFELFDPKNPFLQVPGLRGGGKKGDEDGMTPVSKLDFALAAGNNSTLFDHGATLHGRTSPSEKLALNLLTFQMFSPGGTKGNVRWGGIDVNRFACDAPCAPGSMLHTFLRGKNLRESLHLNLLSEEELTAYARLGGGWKGRPVWEMMPSSPKDRPAVDNATRTFLGRMVPLSRAIRLLPDHAFMLAGGGFEFPSFSNPKNTFPQEVTATTILDTKINERVLLGIQPEKALWRQLHAFTARRHDEDEPGGCAALARCNDTDVSDIVACGLAHHTDKIIDAVESVFSVPGALFQDAGHSTYEAGVRQAEKVDQELGFALDKWRTAIDGGWQARLKMAGPKKWDELGRLRQRASLEYWTRVEKGLPLLLEAVETVDTPAFPERCQAWCRLLEQSALGAYELACSRDTERQMRAYVAGRSALLSGIRRVLPQETREEA